MKRVYDVHHEREMLEFKVDDFLRRAGWKSTTSTVGCFWLWERTIEGRVYLVEKEMALSIQANLDPVPSDEDES